MKRSSCSRLVRLVLIPLFLAVFLMGSHVFMASQVAAASTPGSAWAWGRNEYGTLGDGSTTDRHAPVQVGGSMAGALTGVVAISAEDYHSLALKSDGTAWAWGFNYSGQLGDGSTTDRLTPVQVSGLTGVVAVEAGWNFSVALKSDGTAWAWGHNYSGQLGDGSTTDRHTPVQVNVLTGVVAISAGGGHSLALESGGTVYAWGDNLYGQLGDGTTTGSHTPVQVSGLTGVVAISAGDRHSLALKSDGTVWAWGDNEYGRLGDGTTTDRHTPVQVSGLTGVIAISGRYYHNLALKSNGTVWAWGYNNSGQLGIGTTTEKHTPVQVSGLTGVVAISAGGLHSLALKPGGTVWAWGNNLAGQLGIGTTTEKHTPVQVSGLTGVIGIRAGAVYSTALKGASATPVPGINLNFPNGGDNWAAGSSQNIAWTSANFSGNVSVALSRDSGSTWATLAASTANTGSLIWTVTGPGTTQARLRVTSVSKPSATDKSDADFTITFTPPSITVTSPNGGESWAAGSSQTITWTSTGVAGPVKIQLTRNSGATWATIVASTPNTGSKALTVTTPGTTQARFRVTSVSTPAATDTSDANFSITVPPPSITVTSPNGGESWTTSSSHNITWTSVSLAPITLVKIELSRDSGSTWTTIVASTGNMGSKAWTVTGPGTTQARVRVTSVSAPAATDMSNSDFTIVGPTVTMIYPNGGEIWPIGSSKTIHWTSTGTVPGLVKIELSKNGGTTWTTLLNTTVPGPQYLTTSVSGPGTTQALVRVRSVLDPSVSDTSDAYFTIPPPTVTVTAPVAGENWAIGSPQNITWTSAGLPATTPMKIELTRDGTTWSTIAASTPNSGTKAWTVTGPGTGTAKVRVSVVATPAVSGASLYFFIPSPSIAVTSPNGGETWAIGSSQNITWRSVSVTGMVKIALSRDSGATWVTIVASTANTGSKAWTVTGPATTHIRVRVTSISTPSVTDTSDDNFTIPSPSISVTSPNGGENWAVDSTHDITWSSAGVYGPVKIEISRDSGLTWTTIAASTANTGSMPWKVTGPATRYAMVRISSSIAGVSDKSNDDFYIALSAM